MHAWERGGGGFRADIEGLRAVAIVGVLCYHSGIPGFAGGFVGVDIFFVISGFLITGLLLRSRDPSLGRALLAFYSRRIRRLLPAALTVLAVTAVAARLLLPAIEWHRTAGDIASAALYVSNFRFAAQGSDYLDAALAPSPVLHYWSLSVEEQFYLAWPLLIFLVALSTRRRPNSRVLVAVGMGVLVAASFAMCLRTSQTDPTWGFFAPWTRAWQFGVGGLLALASFGPPRRWAARTLSVLGVLAIGWSVNQAGGYSGYPGAFALVPTLGAAALIAAGAPRRVGGAPDPTERRPWVTRVLSGRPATAVGRVSYSWYLWHWPPLAILTLVLGEWPWPGRAAVVMITVVPAIVSYRWVESPLRRSDGPLRGLRRPALVGVVLATATAAFSLSVLGVIAGAPGAPAPIANADTAGAEEGARSQIRHAPGSLLIPQPEDARQDIPSVYRNGCHADIKATAPGICTFAAPARQATATLALIGDSHAAQWFPALREAADRRGWRLVALTKSGCPASDITVMNDINGVPYTQCDRFRAAVMERLRQLQPDLVVLSEFRGGYSGVDPAGHPEAIDDDAWDAALTRTLENVGADGSRAALLADTPGPGFDVPACVSRNRDSPQACTFDAASAVTHSPFGRLPASGDDRVHDFTDLICPSDRCSPVVAGWLAYRDADHLTASFARALARPVGSSLQAQLDGESSPG